MNYLKNKKILIIIWFFIISTLNVSIYMINKNILNKISDFLILFINIIILTFLLYFLMQIVCEYIKNRQIKIFENEKSYDKIYERKYFIIVWLIQFICWLPIFLAFYPGGALLYDAPGQILQAVNGYNTKHPLLHTLYLQFFYYIFGGKIFHNYTIGMAFATITQMLIFSAMLTYMHLFLLRIKLVKWMRFAIIIYISIFPLVPYLSICMTKDIFFTGFMCILFTYLGYYIRLPKYNNFINNVFFVISVIGVILFRNNGIYPIIGIIMGLLFIDFKKHHISKLLKLTVLGVAIGSTFFMSTKVLLNADKGPIIEAFSVPVQQIALTYKDNKENLSNEDIKNIKYILPTVESYRSEISDPVKGACENTKDKLNILIPLYFKLLLKYPNSYVKAFLLLNGGYFSITDLNWSDNYWRGYNRYGYFPWIVPDGFSIYHKTYIPFIENLYIKLFCENEYQKVFALNILLHPALYFYIILSLMIFSLLKKQYELIPMISFMTIFILTLLFGPTVLSRYMLPYVICIPIMFVCVIKGIKNEVK